MVYAGCPEAQIAYDDENHQTSFIETMKCAKNGLVNAQFNLGYMYSNGIGVTQDFVAAHAWYNIAGSFGDLDARKRRDNLASRMNSNQIAEAQKLAKKLFKKIKK